MRPFPHSHSKPLAAMLFLSNLVLSSLSCTAITSLWASPTPTITPSPTPTTTPTITPTLVPSPTPDNLLSPGQRSGYLVILRYVGEGVHQRFFAIQEYLIQQGYSVKIDSGPSAVGDMDVILFGALACNRAIDDLTILLAGRLSVTGLARVRFTSDDSSYEENNIVIQIQSVGLFGPAL